ncbi:DNA polymerase III subunit beta [Salicibibacter halophilus]|uniref:Beta sliding clamp n=1 Tax=Salicibibacter halophilus TaxID=2502791 RepID=A0A514LIG3_9BACI|nr:DNA polymerase III subunit beta [Salicibibacter halophilus]QDI91637.1 DNA polymerase III subunit beta [Salicibibacter halophilus]
MHFSIDTHAFITGVQNANKAVSSRTTIPILTGIKIKVETKGITLIGSDSDVSIETFIPKSDEEQTYMTIHEEGEMVLQAKYFSEIVRKMPGETLTLEKDGNMAATISSGNVVFHLNGFDPDNYPKLPQLEEEQVILLPQHLLKDIIRQTVFAVSTQETRPVLTGVHFSIKNRELTATATDSHRLAMRTVGVETDETLEINNVIIPGKSLTELSRILDDSEDMITIVVTKTQVLFKMNHLLFFSRLLDGKFPLTSNMIPSEGKTTVTLPTKALNQSLERAMLLSREAKNNVVHIKSIGTTEIEIMSISAEVGKVKESIEAQEINGAELQIAFNGKNILDALKTIDSEIISLMFTGTMSPFVVQPLDHQQMIHLFSPVRTS